MKASTYSKSCFAGLALIALAPSLTQAQTTGGFGLQMTGQFGPAMAPTNPLATTWCP